MPQLMPLGYETFKELLLDEELTALEDCEKVMAVEDFVERFNKIIKGLLSNPKAIGEIAGVYGISIEQAELLIKGLGWDVLTIFKENP